MRLAGDSRALTHAAIKNTEEYRRVKDKMEDAIESGKHRVEVEAIGHDLELMLKSLGYTVKTYLPEEMSEEGHTVIKWEP